MTTVINNPGGGDSGGSGWGAGIGIIIAVIILVIAAIYFIPRIRGKDSDADIKVNIPLTSQQEGEGGY